MTDESTSSDQFDGSSPSPREKLDKAAKLRAEAAQLIAAADKIDDDRARLRKEGTLRDRRIFGGVVMELAENAPDLARVLIEGIGSCSVSKSDRKHLEREGSALKRLRKIIEAPSSDPSSATEPVAAEVGVWFAVPFNEKDRVPKGVIYDPTKKARFAPTEALVKEMRLLGFEERPDLADRLPPGRK